MDGITLRGPRGPKKHKTKILDYEMNGVPSKVKVVPFNSNFLLIFLYEFAIAHVEIIVYSID